MASSFNKFIFPLIVISILSVGAYFFLIRPLESGGDVVEVKLGTVSRGDIIDKKKLKGKVTANKTVAVLSNSSGQVTQISVKTGDLVAKDTVLLTLDQSKLMADIEKSRLTLEKQKINLDNATEAHSRKKALHDEKFIAELEYIQAEKNLSLAQVDFELAEKELLSLEKQLGQNTIKAPLTGVVTKINVEEGEIITMGGESASGKSLFVLTDAREKSIELQVNEIDRQTLNVGQLVSCWVDADPSTFYPGKIVKIGAAATGDEKAEFHLFRVEVEILEGDDKLILGVNAGVEVVTSEKKDILKAPIEAIFNDKYPFAYVKNLSGEFVKTKVSAGLSDVHHIEIKEGLKEGDVVALEEPLLD